MENQEPEPRCLGLDQREEVLSPRPSSAPRALWSTLASALGGAQQWGQHHLAPTIQGLCIRLLSSHSQRSQSRRARYSEAVDTGPSRETLICRMNCHAYRLRKEAPAIADLPQRAQNGSRRCRHLSHSSEWNPFFIPWMTRRLHCGWETSVDRGPWLRIRPLVVALRLSKVSCSLACSILFLI